MAQRELITDPFTDILVARVGNVEVLTISPGPAMDTQTSKVKRVFASRDFPLDPVPVLDVSESGVRCMA